MGSPSREAAARLTDVDTGHEGPSIAVPELGEEALAEEGELGEIVEAVEESTEESEESTDEAEGDAESSEASEEDADENAEEDPDSELDAEEEPEELTAEELAEAEALAAAAAGGHIGPPTAIITGSSNVFINSLPAARLGDILAPHHPGIRTICEGTASVLINGQPASRVSDAIDCGGTIATGSDNVFIGDLPSLDAPSDASLPDIVFPNQRTASPKTQPPSIGPITSVNASSETVSYTPTAHTNDTNVRVEAPSLASHKQAAIEHWQNAEINAKSFPAAYGARLMRLNAEAGHDAAQGIKNLYETFTDWNKFKSAVGGVYNTVANPKETFKALKAAAGSFADLPADEKGEAAYKLLVGTLAGGGVAKAGKVLPKGNSITLDSSIKRDRDVVPNKQLNSYGDHLRDILGPARTSHPEEYASILDEAKQRGVDVVDRPGGLAYEPALSQGNPGRLLLDSDASIGAMRHEFRHVLDDQASGYQGFRLMMDSDQFWKLEYRGYMEEINLARELKEFDTGRKIVQEMRTRRQEILGR